MKLWKRTLLLAVICAWLLCAGTLALTSFEAAGDCRCEGGVYTPDIPEEAEPLYSEGLAAVCADGLWGYADTDGVLVIEPVYDSGGRFSEGVAPVSLDGRRFYIDKTGREVIDASAYDAICPFENGYARVERDGLWGLADRTGRLAVDTVYEEICGVSEGLAAAKKDGLWGFVTTGGKTAAAFEYDRVSSFADGTAYAERGGTGYLIDTEGNVLAEDVYSELIQGLVLVRTDSGWGFADGTGEIAVECLWQDVTLPAEGFFGVCTEGKWGFADFSGTVVIPEAYDAVGQFSEGRAAVRTAGAYGFIDTQGQRIGGSYRAVRGFSGGYAAVSSDGTHWGYIDSDGRDVIAESFDYVTDFADGRALAGRDGAFYILNEAGEILSFYPEGSASLLTTAAEETQTEPESTQETKKTINLRTPIALTLSVVLLLYTITAALLRAVNLRRKKRRRR